jgi:hypothetical protein
MPSSIVSTCYPLCAVCIGATFYPLPGFDYDVFFEPEEFPLQRIVGGLGPRVILHHLHAPPVILGLNLLALPHGLRDRLPRGGYRLPGGGHLGVRVNDGREPLAQAAQFSVVPVGDAAQDGGGGGEAEGDDPGIEDHSDKVRVRLGRVLSSDRLLGQEGEHAEWNRDSRNY